MGSKKKDDYEADFMGGEDALFREKNVSRLFAGLMALPALAAVAGAVAVAIDPSGGLLPALIPLSSGALVTATGLYFAVMRTTVTEQRVQVQYGTLGPSIDVATITDSEVVALSAMEKMMFGPKMSTEGWRYIPPGASGGVRITWRADGKSKTCIIGAADPNGLAAAIGDARARSSVATGVRVQVDQDEEEIELEAAATRKSGRERSR